MTTGTTAAASDAGSEQSRPDIRDDSNGSNPVPVPEARFWREAEL